VIGRFQIGLRGAVVAGLALAAAGFFAQIVLDNSFARLTAMWMVKYMWTVPTVMALGNVIWLYYR